MHTAATILANNAFNQRPVAVG